MAAVKKILSIIRMRMPELKQEYKVKSIGVFGSYARGEQKKNSDVDMLVEFSETPDLFEFVGLKDCLSGFIGKNVDLVMKDALKPRIGRNILREVVMA